MSAVGSGRMILGLAAPLPGEGSRYYRFIVVVVNLVGRVTRQMLRLFTKVFDGSHLGMACVEYHQVRSLSIFADARRPLDIDGEVKGTTPVSIQTISGAVRIFC